MEAHVDVGKLTPKEYRQMVRKGEWTGSSMEACKGWALSDMIIVPREYAFDLFLFAQRNPQILPLIEVTDPGSPVPSNIASDTDIRTDLPRYQVFKNGELATEPTDILDHWQDDLVTFFTGCSIAFDRAFELARVNFRGVGAFSTNIPCIPAGPFQGDMVVSVRIFASANDAIRAIQISSRYPKAHGAPIHTGDSATIGIKDLCSPDRIVLPGEITPVKAGEVVLYWPCGGATMREIVQKAKLPLLITDYPKSGFISDKRTEELAIF